MQDETSTGGEQQDEGPVDVHNSEMALNTVCCSTSNIQAETSTGGEQHDEESADAHNSKTALNTVYRIPMRVAAAALAASFMASSMLLSPAKRLLGLLHLNKSQLSMKSKNHPPPILTNLLESFIPGYGIVSEFLLDRFGFDVTKAALACFATSLAVSGVKFSLKVTRKLIGKYAMSHITVHSTDELFGQILDYLCLKDEVQQSRNILATSRKLSLVASEDFDEFFPSLSTADGAAFINFRTYMLDMPFKYEVTSGTRYFRHNGCLFEITRVTREDEGYKYSRGRYEARESIILGCLGRSAAPIKDLLREARAMALSKLSSTTCVYRPLPKDIRDSESNPWGAGKLRPSRGVESIDLDETVKAALLSDINEFLQPTTQKWYTSRGIPYRRGYLFHGPPGTGKSSLAFAIAGAFGLHIYTISLLDQSISEENLCQLMSELPDRCIVLLEDIDSAGIKREVPTVTEAPREPHLLDEPPVFEATNNAHPSAGLSLSSLLNAIDGVAAHEGRVLIMTSNQPSSLDSALVRPGRIDMKVCFTLATKHQIRQLYMRMYEDWHVSTHAHAKLEALANAFATLVPEGSFSPAEVQGFLLFRKKDPHAAVVEVSPWVMGEELARRAREKKEKKGVDESNAVEPSREGANAGARAGDGDGEFSESFLSYVYEGLVW